MRGGNGWVGEGRLPVVEIRVESFYDGPHEFSAIVAVLAVDDRSEGGLCTAAVAPALGRGRGRPAAAQDGALVIQVAVVFVAVFLVSFEPHFWLLFAVLVFVLLAVVFVAAHAEETRQETRRRTVIGRFLVLVIFSGRRSVCGVFRLRVRLSCFSPSLCLLFFCCFFSVFSQCWSQLQVSFARRRRRRRSRKKTRTTLCTANSIV